MPELPEVETVKTAIKSKYVGKVIDDVIINYPKIIENISTSDFIKTLKGQKINNIDRKGKFLIFTLSSCSLLFHLRMEGKIKDDINNIDKHSHVIIKFIDDSYLIYHDVRKFGRIYYFNKDEDVYNLAPLNKLGIDANLKIDVDYLYKKFKTLKGPLKNALLDQSIIAGIGNIYADEICFKSKLSPLRKASSLSKDDCNAIIEATNYIINEAIKYKGSTIKSFQSQHGVNGNYQDKLLVYGKGNTPCPICNNLLIKTKINGRGTTYCKVCER